MTEPLTEAHKQITNLTHALATKGEEVEALEWLVKELKLELAATGSTLCRLHEGDVANYRLTTLAAIERVNKSLALTVADYQCRCTQGMQGCPVHDKRADYPGGKTDA